MTKNAKLKIPMMQLSKLHKGDQVAILSPSFAAPGVWPAVYDLGLQRLREVFELEPVEFPTTKKVGATAAERSQDLIAAFTDPKIKAVIATLGGNDQVTYIKHLPKEPFQQNPKPFFGFSDNTHFANFLWQCGVPSFYGGSLFTQFAQQGKMHDYTVKYLKQALFWQGEMELEASPEYNDIDLDWFDPANLQKSRVLEPNAGWQWFGEQDAQGITWGGCLESLDELLRHDVAIPSLQEFANIVLLTETSEEIPSAEYVFRVYRALGERGILAKVKAVLVGRPKAWELSHQQTQEEKARYRQRQQEVIVKTVRQYNSTIPIVTNLDFGHTDPQIPMPYGANVRVETQAKKIFVEF